MDIRNLIVFDQVDPDEELLDDEQHLVSEVYCSFKFSLMYDRSQYVEKLLFALTEEAFLEYFPAEFYLYICVNLPQTFTWHQAHKLTRKMQVYGDPHSSMFLQIPFMMGYPIHPSRQAMAYFNIISRIKVNKNRINLLYALYKCMQMAGDNLTAFPLKLSYTTILKKEPIVESLCKTYDLPFIPYIRNDSSPDKKQHWDPIKFLPMFHRATSYKYLSDLRLSFEHISIEPCSSDVLPLHLSSKNPLPSPRPSYETTLYINGKHCSLPCLHSGTRMNAFEVVEQIQNLRFTFVDPETHLKNFEKLGLKLQSLPDDQTYMNCKIYKVEELNIAALTNLVIPKIIQDYPEYIIAKKCTEPYIYIHIPSK